MMSRWSLGKRLVKTRVPEGVAGLAQLQGLIADHLPDDAEAADVVVGIETDRGRGCGRYWPPVTRCSR